MRTLRSAFLILALGAPLSAQQPGTVEVGALGQLTWFDDETTLTDAGSGGFAGLLGVFVAPNLALEGLGSRTWTEDGTAAGVDGTWTALRARVVYGIPVTETFQPLIGFGLVRNSYADAVDGSDTGVSPLVGVKAYVGDRLALRADVQADYVGSPFNDGATLGSGTVNSHLNWTASAGLTYDVGRGRARDTDGDGVLDRDDRCPATPLGVGVDAAGCRLDADGDGVYDEADRCPATPSGVRVDTVGCRVDADGDGVYDEDDQCASTPNGVRVDASGCRVDTDGDGVYDEDDRCESTPRGARVDASGCRLDSDGDGVYDEDDRCASTPRGTRVDARGCPVIFEADQRSVVLEGVTFETSSAQLTAGARGVLDRVAQSLVANPEIRVRVSGHTDATGSRAYNTRLSQERADAVVAYLVERGVAASRMEARGFGPERPIATNDTDEGRRMNRRVELERIN